MKQKFIALGAFAAVLAAAFLLWRQFSGPRVNLRPSAAVGEVLADEVVRLLDGKGTVVLISRQPPRDGPDSNRAKIASFEAALQRRGGVKLAATDWLPRPPAGVMDNGVVTSEQFLTALEKNPNANAFVVLAGLPPISQPLQEKIAARSLKLLAVCGYTANVKQWLQSKTLSVAVVPRFDDLPAETPPPKSARDWFDREYQIFDPGSIRLLPY